MKKSTSILLTLILLAMVICSCTKKEDIEASKTNLESIAVSLANDREFVELVSDADQEIKEFASILERHTSGRKIKELSVKEQAMLFQAFEENEIISAAHANRQSILMKHPDLKFLSKADLTELFKLANKSVHRNQTLLKFNTQASSDSLLGVCTQDCDVIYYSRIQEAESFLESELVAIEQEKESCYRLCYDATCRTVCNHLAYYRLEEAVAANAGASNGAYLQWQGCLTDCINLHGTSY